MKEEDIILSGIGLTRIVFINGEELKPSEGLKFDWGYVCDSSKHLSKQILSKLYNADKNSVMATEFYRAIVCLLPNGNFNVAINMAKLEYWIKNTLPVKSRSPFALMKLRITENLTITKFLDFPNNDIKTAIFRKGTIEYAELLALEEYNMLFELNRYYESKTKTMDVHSTEEMWASLKYSEIDKAFVYVDGMGSLIEFEGHKIEEYDI